MEIKMTDISIEGVPRTDEGKKCFCDSAESTSDTGLKSQSLGVYHPLKKSTRYQNKEHYLYVLTQHTKVNNKYVDNHRGVLRVCEIKMKRSPQ